MTRFTSIGVLLRLVLNVVTNQDRIFLRPQRATYPEPGTTVAFFRTLGNARPAALSLRPLESGDKKSSALHMILEPDIQLVRRQAGRQFLGAQIRPPDDELV